ncbi:MAG: type II toxin-antitoxin system RelE/ParE family toxin [Runella slithyformis]|nr:MAG: type II toxin-antitoxin system RelE/ParE family toxin [Runella slithyformis]TAF81518.1 MAG: type II toxin-antitoxin system RelE/ParE family toxin [Runella slithyformis]
MDYQIIWSDESQNEIREILEFLLDEWGDAAADKFSEQVLQVSNILEKHPFAGQRNTWIESVRELPVKPYYLVHYTVLETLKIVYVLNLIDSRRKK